MDRNTLHKFFIEVFSKERLSKKEASRLLRCSEVGTLSFWRGLSQEKPQKEYLYLLVEGSLSENRKEDYSSLGEPVWKKGEFLADPTEVFASLEGNELFEKEPVQIAEIDLTALQASEEDLRLYGKVWCHVAGAFRGDLHSTRSLLQELSQEKLDAKQASQHISTVIVQIFVLMSIWFAIANFIVEVGGAHYYRIFFNLFTPIMLSAFSVAVILLIARSHYPLEFYGLTWKHGGRCALEGILYSIPAILFLTFCKWLFVRYSTLFAGMPLFRVEVDVRRTLLWGIIYAFFTPLQEIIIRGTIQSSFRNFFRGKYRSGKAILVSNLVFQMVHAVRGFYLSLASFLLGLYWGLLFDRQKSIIGVSVSHFLLGLWGFFVLEFDTILHLIDFEEYQQCLRNQVYPF
ncbi:MAG: type II CAAX endopeptidase family protein [Chlamydiota bacterium]